MALLERHAAFQRDTAQRMLKQQARMLRVVESIYKDERKRNRSKKSKKEKKEKKARRDKKEKRQKKARR
jgi:hypothetical protein